MDFKIYCGLKIKDIRTVSGLTQKEFSESLEISRGALVNYEAGKRQAPKDVLKNICNIYNVDFSIFNVPMLVDESDLSTLRDKYDRLSEEFNDFKKEAKEENTRLKKIVDFLMAQLPNQLGNFLKGSIKSNLFGYQVVNITQAV